MSGLLFVVCVPTSEHEATLNENSKYKSISSVLSDDNAQQISISRSQSPNVLKKSTSSPESLDETDNNATCSSYVSKKSKELYISNDDTKQGRSNIDSTKNILSDTRVKSDSCHTERALSNEEISKSIMKKRTTDWTKLQRFEGTVPMEKVLEMLLKKLKIENAVWCAGENDQFFQVFFSVGSGDHSEEILRHLNESGIGAKLNSSVSVIPCSLYYQGKDKKAVVDESPRLEQIEECNQKSAKISAWNKFMSSVRARLIVAQVVEGVKADADLTFDFVALLIVAGCVAAMGLVENSSVILVASMLISPLMGPILAGTFGAVIGDKHLQKIGILNELFGLFMCLLVGFCFGLAAGLATDHWGNSAWPTEEMLARGQIRSLWVGVLIALPSGAGVAIGILGDNTASLVGVAISASLLPPAVNAGLFWALSLMDLMWQGRIKLQDDDANATDVTSSYSPLYSHNPSVELAVLGAVSLCLTLVNIICIFFAGILVFKIKEVSPSTSKDEQQFWKHDIKIARDYNRTFQGEDAEELEKRLAEDLAQTKLQSNINGISPDMYNTLQSIGSHTLAPEPLSCGTDFLQKRRLSVQELERIYTTFSTTRSEGTVEVPLVPLTRRRHSSGVLWRGGNEVNSAAIMRAAGLLQTADPSALPTITESISLSLSGEYGSSPSTLYTYPSMSSVQPQHETSSSAPGSVSHL